MCYLPGEQEKPNGKPAFSANAAQTSQFETIVCSTHSKPKFRLPALKLTCSLRRILQSCLHLAAQKLKFSDTERNDRNETDSDHRGRISFRKTV